ncbi:hypothetical protein RND61_14420 [Streptomyces sp. TRM76323]|uniref:Integral membrane protein n=1 Tax=Streptomyces tamarix TaxID=3078565 RepID=A0ABU3QLI7_9ACTN|nr:hypothetical protein [Streptomyces tamarix]MDT9683257.1 hypothetical protein [Streptomyces tamarix]
MKRYATPLSTVLIFASIKAVGLAVLAFWSHAQEKSALHLLGRRWDSLWYARVAEHGYDFTLTAPDGRELSSMAFFPLLPWLERAVSVTGLTLNQAGLFISAMASVVAALGLFHLGRHVHSPEVGTLLVCLWASLPVAIVQSMAYSESLFVALAAWSLYFLLQDRWGVAALLACAAGLTRPVGVAIGIAMCTHALTRLRRADNRARILASCALSLSGTAAYVLWVGAQRGNFFGYLGVQAAWGNGFDGGYSFARFLGEFISPSPILTAVLLIAIIALSVTPHVMMRLRGYPPALIAYSTVVTAMAMGASGYFGSKPRLLVPAFPLLLLVAIALQRSAKPYLCIASLVMASALYGAFWLNGSGPP